MKQLSLTLKSDDRTIGYLLDGEQMRYSSGTFGPDGKIVEEDESGEIADTRMMALRLYWIIKTALDEAGSAPLPTNPTKHPPEQPVVAPEAGAALAG